MDTAICKHSLDFSIALVLFCTCMGFNMVMVKVTAPLGAGQRWLCLFKNNDTQKLACIHARIESHCLFVFIYILGEPIPKTNCGQSEMENHTVLCRYRHRPVHLCSGKINKYLSGSNRERSIGEGMAVPELRTRFFKKLVRKELKYSMYKNTYSQ